jgi:hypothetical protein
VELQDALASPALHLGATRTQDWTRIGRSALLIGMTLTARGPAICCLEDVSAAFVGFCRVRFSQARSGAGSVQSPGVRSGYAWWNDRENDQPARPLISSRSPTSDEVGRFSASHHASVSPDGSTSGLRCVAVRQHFTPSCTQGSGLSAACETDGERKAPIFHG